MDDTKKLSPEKKSGLPTQAVSTSTVEGKTITVAIHRLKKKYGVATYRDGMVISRDYKNAGQDLSAFDTHAKDVIDWVSLDVAQQRYLQLVTGHFNKEASEGKAMRAQKVGEQGPPTLRLIKTGEK